MSLTRRLEPEVRKAGLVAGVGLGEWEWGE